MAGRKVREAMGRHLVRHVEKLLEILDRKVPSPFGRQHRGDGSRFGDQHSPGEVVGLHSLAQEVCEVGRFGMAERKVPQRLDRHGACLPGAQRIALADVDPAVFEVGDGSGRRRDVLYSTDREAEVSGEIEQRALGDGSGARVVNRSKRLRCRPLDLLEIVVAAPHLGAERSIG